MASVPRYRIIKTASYVSELYYNSRYVKRDATSNHYYACGQEWGYD